jgi:uncharacterized protein (TIGR03000 family)
MSRRIVSLRVLTPLALLAAFGYGPPTCCAGVDGRGARSPGGASASKGRQVYYGPPLYYAAPLSGAYGPGQGYQYFYPPPSGEGGMDRQGNRAVTVNVSVPADAEIWFDGTKTAQTGTARRFVSSPVTPGPDYTYEVKVRWRENGTAVIQTRRVIVHAGDVINLRFTADQPQSASGR